MNVFNMIIDLLSGLDGYTCVIATICDADVYLTVEGDEQVVTIRRKIAGGGAQQLDTDDIS